MTSSYKAIHWTSTLRSLNLAPVCKKVTNNRNKTKSWSLSRRCPQQSIVLKPVCASHSRHIVFRRTGICVVTEQGFSKIFYLEEEHIFFKRRFMCCCSYSGFKLSTRRMCWNYDYYQYLKTTNWKTFVIMQV